MATYVQDFQLLQAGFGELGDSGDEVVVDPKGFKIGPFHDVDALNRINAIAPNLDFRQLVEFDVPDAWEDVGDFVVVY